MPKRKKSARFVSRGGDKLDGALTEFGFDVTKFIVADLGANVGGFTDCLLQRGAGRIYAVDTGYGVLDWKLRQDDRVEVMERTNALHVSLPEQVDLVVIDVAWTSLVRIVPVALNLIGPNGHVVALLKPQYEAKDEELEKGVVLPDCTQGVVDRVMASLSNMDVHVVAKTASSIPGSGGNQEFLLLLKPQ